MREAILLGGGTNVGKTLTLVSLAWLKPESRVVIFDPENKVRLILEEMGITPEDLPNLQLVLVTPDWGSFTTTYKGLKTTLTDQDWVCFDMAGRFWDLAQNYFAREVFGMSPAEHIVALRKASKRADFEGFDGLTDWTVIKRMHNEDIMDDAVLWSPFNVCATTSLTSYSAREKLPNKGVEGLMVQEFPDAPKLEGEKHNKFRYDTIGVLYQKLRADDNPAPAGAFCFKIVKHKGKIAVPPLQEYDVTGRLFWGGYEDYKEGR